MSKSLARKQIDGDDVAVKYGSEAQVLCDWIDTTNFVLIGGRGLAKSTVIIARRSYRCMLDMPGAPFAIVANTYANLTDNIMPAVQNGWRLLGLIEGVHYVKGHQPPLDWKRRCSVIVDDYRHVYSFYNGAVLFLGSLDNPSLLAGKSVVHLFFDEAKYASDARAARVMPILRGDAMTFGRSHLFLGTTITTDMPDVTEGEYDWFFRYAAEMDPQRIVKTIQAAAQRNEYLIKLTAEERKPAPSVGKIDRLERKIAYYDAGLLKLRKGQTYFANMSSLVNIDILTIDYIRRLYSGALELHEFQKSVLGMRPGVRKSARFYVLFDDTHKYTDGTTTGEAAFDCRDLKYLHPDKPLDGGMDFGNMLSFVVAQHDGAYYRVHKNFYEIPPRWFRELADQFLEFFAEHRCKTLHMYYDRAGNNFQSQGEDYASKIKDAIEKDANGRRTGWNVVLMSRKQATIKQNAEFAFMHELMSERNAKLPRLRVDVLNCVEMVSSIEGAKAEVRYKGSVKLVAKVKKTEKLEPKKLPKLSTNFSDAFKYLMMRREWTAAATGGRPDNTAADAAAEQWMAERMKER
jgi:hypothetical protein